MAPPTDAASINDRRWAVLAVMNLSLVIVVAGNSALNVALPTIVRDLDATSSQLQWIVDAYALVFAGLLLPMGALGDRFGRKGMLQGGLSIFALRLAHRRLRHRTVAPHRHPLDHGRRGGDDHARHPLDHHQRVPAAGALQGHRHLGRLRRCRRRHRPGAQRLPARALLVRLGLPGQHPDRGRRPRLRRPPGADLAGPPPASPRPRRRPALDGRPLRPPLRHHRGRPSGAGPIRVTVGLFVAALVLGVAFVRWEHAHRRADAADGAVPGPPLLDGHRRRSG